MGTYGTDMVTMFNVQDGSNIKSKKLRSKVIHNVLNPSKRSQPGISTYEYILI
jgi:hypothetical protein